MRPLVIVGTAGNAYDILDVVEAINARLFGPQDLRMILRHSLP